MASTLRKVVSGLTYQSSWLDDRLVASLFGKHYRYSADVNEGVLVADSAGQQIYVSRTVQNRESDLGLGGAVRYRLLPTLLLKLSAEQSRRLPESEEALGNGNTITNSPGLRPERSRNLNLGVRLDRLAAGAHDFALASSVFLRETDDLILLTVIDGQGTGQFQNVAESGGWGVEGEVSWRWGARVEATVQGTYLDLRNRQRLTSAGVRNTVYGDRLRNTPFLFGNANLQVRLPRLPVLGDDATAYWNAGWVREFYLNWPSVGAAGTKAVIPSQLVHDVGASVTLLRAGGPEGRTIMTAGLDVQNVFDVRVYDNYLLQRPGRSVAVKLRASL